MAVAWVKKFKTLCCDVSAFERRNKKFYLAKVDKENTIFWLTVITMCVVPQAKINKKLKLSQTPRQVI